MALSDQEMRIVAALGQTMFPRDAVLGIDGEDAQVVPWVDDYLGRMPPFSRAQIRGLLNTFEYGYAAWAGRPRDTFSAARPDARAAYLESWERSATYTQRMLYEALRAMMTFAYVESEAVATAIRPPEDEATATRTEGHRAAEEA
ncbi:MAG: gluconate 2-dehydrogenase subunit 3 family protein [Alphaproteobacteria bacterium]|nr:gluconate 2-dehydrogenase subunit 3 family protein [Alphaproteobacteria bacterium]MCB9699667.1 gluconate 2-dehydrogenase subunit 3 family protein [Alphaproteobacteria bacterium]